MYVDYPDFKCCRDAGIPLFVSCLFDIVNECSIIWSGKTIVSNPAVTACYQLLGICL